MPRGMVVLFAIASGMSVANVYYAQPLLDAIASDFTVELSAIGGVITATQVGCALALILLVPLGDRVDRRRLMIVQWLALIAALLMVALAPSTLALLAGMLGVGLLGTAMTQGLIAYAASAAPPAQQGRVVGAAQGGVFVGLLLARVVAGGVSDVAGWRGVYVAAAFMMAVLAPPLLRRLPALARPGAGQQAVSYLKLIASMFTLLFHDRLLQRRGMLAMLMFAAFNIFWSALALRLTAPPFSLSHVAVGALGLVGAIGALAATRAGRWADAGHGQVATGFSLALLLVAWWPLSHMESSLAALIVGIVLLDVGGQALHVTNQSLIFRDRSGDHSRLVGAYMLFYSVGSGAGALASTVTFAHAGWYGVCVLGAGVSATAGVFWLSVDLARKKRDAPS
ncbi:MFS transporter [Pigmentiphaga litoralis]|uniref:MFS transporter n=1 Tax=Pigmentiphaga litoralis TaxID=516702 RepID=UPI003B43D19D